MVESLTLIPQTIRQHPVYKGVKKRNNSHLWFSDFIEPKKKRRVPLGSFLTAEMAARAYDVASLAFHGDSAPLNFPDSKWHFCLPPSFNTLRHLVRAAREAAVLFRPREKKDYVDDCCSSTSSSGPTDEGKVTSSPKEVASASEEMMSSSEELTSASSCSSEVCDTIKDETSESCCSSWEVKDETKEITSNWSEVKYDAKMAFDLWENGDMDVGSYYASLAEALMIEPPAGRFGFLED